MARELAVAKLSDLGAAAKVIERVLPDVYRMTSVAPSPLQSLTAALLWAGEGSAAAVHSAGEIYAFDGATDYEFDNDKWSVPGRHGFRIVLATWSKVTQHPDALIHELTTTLAAEP